MGPETTMQEVLASHPGARRALFRKYHIGGCSSCGFTPDETLAQLSERNGNLPVAEVIRHIEFSHHSDQQMAISPRELADLRTRGEKVRLLDLRTREEWEAVRLDGAEFVNQDLIQRLMGKEGLEGLLVFYDHAGAASPDAAAYFAGHGFSNARTLVGGIDAWSRDIDPKLPRYKLENA